MSRTDRAIGLARSLLVYHAIPLRQRRMQRLQQTLTIANNVRARKR